MARLSRTQLLHTATSQPSAAAQLSPAQLTSSLQGFPAAAWLHDSCRATAPASPPCTSCCMRWISGSDNSAVVVRCTQPERMLACITVGASAIAVCRGVHGEGQARAGQAAISNARRLRQVPLCFIQSVGHPCMAACVMVGCRQAGWLAGRLPHKSATPTCLQLCAQVQGQLLGPGIEQLQAGRQAGGQDGAGSRKPAGCERQGTARWSIV